MSWGSDEEGKPAGGEAGSTIDNECQAWWVRIRKFLAIILTDTSDTAIGSGADEDNPQVKDECIDSDAFVDGSIDLEHLASDSVDEDKIVSTTLGVGLAGGSGTTLSVDMGQGLVDNSDAIDVDGIVETGAGTHEIKCAVVDIGAWNMNTTSPVHVAHGLTYSKIRAIDVQIINDAENTLNPLDIDGDGYWGIGVADSTKVSLYRKAAGFYDSSSYETLANRGYMMIWYEA